MSDTFWTHNVQVEVTTATGDPILDVDTVRAIIADMAGMPELIDEIRAEPVTETPDGVWLLTVPAQWYAEASDMGTDWVGSHSGGYVVVIPMA